MVWTNIEKIHVFGTVSYSHERKKFETKSKKMFMTRYCSNGYRIWCPKERKIINARNIHFNKNENFKLKLHVAPIKENKNIYEDSSFENEEP